MSAGTFNVARSVWDHPAFRASEFSEREAFIWLISEAAWKPRRHRAGGHIVDLERGQLCHSVRFMAAAWKWTPARVFRFLSKMNEEGMIEKRNSSETAPTVITLCNYDKYQGERNSREGKPEQQRNSSETNYKKERKKEEKEPEANASGASAPSSFHDAIWTRGVLFLTERGVTEKQARSFLGRAKKQHGDEAVFNALASAAKAGAVDPIPYITKALQSVAHPEAQKLEAWGIPDAQPVRPLPRIANIDAKKPPGAPDMPELQREQEEEEREMFISNADTRGLVDILPPLRTQGRSGL